MKALGATVVEKDQENWACMGSRGWGGICTMATDQTSRNHDFQASKHAKASESKLEKSDIFSWQSIVQFLAGLEGK